MGDLQTAVTTGSMLGSLPTASLLGVLVVILGIIAYKTYQDGIKEHGNKLDKITNATEKVAEETRNLNITTKASLEAAKETRDFLIKNIEAQNKKVEEKLDNVKEEIKKSGLQNIGLKKVDGKWLWDVKDR